MQKAEHARDAVLKNTLREEIVPNSNLNMVLHRKESAFTARSQRNSQRGIHEMRSSNKQLNAHCCI